MVVPDCLHGRRDSAHLGDRKCMYYFTPLARRPVGDLVLYWLSLTVGFWYFVRFIESEEKREKSRSFRRAGWKWQNQAAFIKLVKIFLLFLSLRESLVTLFILFLKKLNVCVYFCCLDSFDRGTSLSVFWCFLMLWSDLSLNPKSPDENNFTEKSPLRMYAGWSHCVTHTHTHTHTHTGVSLSTMKCFTPDDIMEMCQCVTLIPF